MALENTYPHLLTMMFLGTKKSGKVLMYKVRLHIQYLSPSPKNLHWWTEWVPDPFRLGGGLESFFFIIFACIHVFFLVHWHANLLVTWGYVKEMIFVTEVVYFSNVKRHFLYFHYKGSHFNLFESICCAKKFSEPTIVCFSCIWSKLTLSLQFVRIQIKAVEL